MIDQLPELTTAQVRQARSLQEQAIKNYTRASANYSPADQVKFSKPYMDGLKADLAKIDAELERRGG